MYYNKTIDTLLFTMFLIFISKMMHNWVNIYYTEYYLVKHRLYSTSSIVNFKKIKLVVFYFEIINQVLFQNDRLKSIVDFTLDIGTNSGIISYAKIVVSHLDRKLVRCLKFNIIYLLFTYVSLCLVFTTKSNLARLALPIYSRLFPRKSSKYIVNPI